MKTRVFLFLAAAALLAGCAKEIQAPLEDQTVVSGPITLQVGINNPKDDLEVEPTQAPTRTVLGEKVGDAYPVYWSKGDQIQINDKTSDALTEVAAFTSSTSFNFSEAPTAPYNVLYPASIYKDASHVTLPAVQTYKAGGFADKMFPMAGYSADGSNITINHLCAIVKVSVKRSADSGADTDNIAAVRFKGRASEKVSGNFEIDYSTPALAAATGTGAELEVRVVESLATSTSDAVVYYLVVPARAYASGFDIIVTDANNDIMTKTKSGAVTLAAGKMYSMAEFAFEPSGTDTGIEIASAEDLIAFATAFNNGDYIALGGLFRATVTADIAFDATSSDAFNLTGGIGTKDDGNGGTNYFNGVFDGNNYTISGLEATVPVFAYTGSAGTVKNLILSSTCSYTVGTGSDSNHGALVGRNKGTVKDCTSNANVIINNIQDVNSANQLYGGLVGYNPGGKIDGCTVTGNITCSQTGQTIIAKDNYASIGGIAGYMSDNGGTINDCKFQGNITVSDATTYGGITTTNKTYFYVGGIVGYANNGVISSCNSGSSTVANKMDVRGVLVPAIGGIVGWIANAASSEVNGCYNYMSLSFTSNGARGDTTPCRIGGIAARTVAPVSNCDNYGAISSTCNSTSLELGGIAGESSGAKISGCTNYSGGTITRSNADQTAAQANRYIYLGGAVGTLGDATDIENCINHAVVTCNVIGTSANTTVDVGGILGGSGSSQVDISGCTNDGEIKFDNNNASAAAIARTALGGILGYASISGTTVTSCTNAGKVWCNNNEGGSYGPIAIGGMIGRSYQASTISDCVNSGAILCQKVGKNTKTTVDVGGIIGQAEGQITISGTNSGDTRNSGTIDVEDTGSNVAYARISMGGVLGFAAAANSTVTNCNNSNQIYCRFTTSGNDRRSYIGGIAGIMANLTYNADGTPNKFVGNAGLEIASCNNTGAVWSRNYNTSGGNKTGNFTGGIIGAIAGQDATHKASVHDCTSATGQTTNYRGFAGGIAGYLSYATLDDNSASQTITGNENNSRGSGGIVGSANNSSTLSNCTFSGTINAACNIGGLAYVFNGGTITECKVNGATIKKGTNAAATAAAVLVSNAGSGTTISNCGVKGTLDGAAITLNSNMITTDGGATVTDTYPIP